MMDAHEFEELLVHWLGEQYGDPGCWTVQKVSERGRAEDARRLFRAERRDPELNLAIKANADRAGNRRQFQALRNLSQAIEDCVAPIALGPDDRFFAMAWVDAPLLDTRMDGPGRAAALTRAGGWLARLQAATAGRPPRGSTLHSLRQPPRREGTRAVAERLRARMRQLPTRSGPTVMLHGDFHPGNLFDAEGGVLAFDRKFDRHGLPYTDAARFLISVADLRDRAAREDRRWSGDAEADRRRFFDGWGPLQERELPLFDLVEDVALFNRWDRLAQRGDDRLYGQVLARGLLDGATGISRPGRLVLQGSGPQWTSAPAPEPPGYLSRLRARWTRSS